MKTLLPAWIALAASSGFGQTGYIPASKNDVQAASASPATPRVSVDSEATTGRQTKGFHDFLGDYRGYYAERTPLSLAAITTGSPDAYGLRMAFGSNMPGFRGVEYAEGDQEFLALKDNVLFVPLDKHADVAQKEDLPRPPGLLPRAKDGHLYHSD